MADNTREKTGDDKSLLEEASTLLMFSEVKPQYPVNAGHVDISNNHVDPADNDLLNFTKKRKISGANDEASVLEPEEKKQKIEDTEDSTEHSSWPVSDSYIVDPDLGLITCICGFDDDDGFSIQCDHCNRWQHALCYNIVDMDTVPDDYLCNVCQPRNLDTKRARRLQMARLKQLDQAKSARKDSKGNNNAGKKVDKYQDVSVNTDSNPDSPKTRNSRSRNYDIQQTSNDETIVPKERSPTKSEQNEFETTSKKPNFFYLSAKSSYEAMYLPINENDYENKTVKNYIEEHNSDDSVLHLKTLDDFRPLEIEVRSTTDVSNQKIFPGFTKLGVYLNESCDKGSLIEEILGHIDFMKNYCTDPRNHYRIWGVTKPKVFPHPTLPIVIDARLCGNFTRYIRRSCNPNVEITTVVSKNPDDNQIKFILKATKDIGVNDELMLPWIWDSKHSIKKVIDEDGNANFEELSKSELYLLINSVDTILRSCDCACGNNGKQCLLLKVKKYSQTLFRSVRSKMNTRYKLNEILNQYQGKRRRQPPILDRFVFDALSSKERSLEVVAELYSEKLKFNHYHNKKRLQRLKDVLSHKKRFNSSSGFDIAKAFVPFKQRLMRPHRTNQKPTSAKDVITDPSKFNEDKIKDVSLLPVIIDLDVKSTPTINSVDRANAARNSEMRKTSLTIDIAEANSNYSVDSPISSTKVSNVEHTENSAPLSADLKSSKKKLSFADYKKKISK